MVESPSDRRESGGTGFSGLGRGARVLGCGTAPVPASSVRGPHKLWETVKDREGWRAAVREVAKTQTRLCD